MGRTGEKKQSKNSDLLRISKLGKKKKEEHFPFMFIWLLSGLLLGSLLLFTCCCAQAVRHKHAVMKNGPTV